MYLACIYVIRTKEVSMTSYCIHNNYQKHPMLTFAIVKSPTVVIAHSTNRSASAG